MTNSLSENLTLTDPDYLWSYSRISQFDNCKYGFYLKYILGLQESGRFFSQFGSFVHKILEQYFKGEIEKDELYTYYLVNFSKEVTAPAPNPKIFNSYFNGGSEYFKNFDETQFGKIVDVEKRIRFNIGDKKFVGVIDLITQSESGEYTLVDHKSRMLKPRSKRKTPTQSDIELDKYFKQLYLYSIPADEAGYKPDYLMFNCFRNGNQIKEKINPAVTEEVKRLMLEKIKTIENNEKWTPNLENEFFCRYLCGLTEQCEYFEMCYGR